MKLQFEDLNESERFKKVKRSLFGDPTGKIKTFAIVSPENPLGWKNATDEEIVDRFRKWQNNPSEWNKLSRKNLTSDYLQMRVQKTGETCLRLGGYNYVPIKGFYAEHEHSYIIFNISLKDATIIASSFGQESFFYGEVKANKSVISYYETKDACKTYKLVEKSSTVTYEDEADEYFSKFGFKFRINMKQFGDDVPDVIDEQAFNESFEDCRTFSSRASRRRDAYRRSNS